MVKAGKGDTSTVKRKATIVSMSDCTLLTLPGDSFIRLVIDAANVWSAEHCRDVLERESSRRTAEDVQQLLTFMRPIRFFQQVRSLCASLP